MSDILGSALAAMRAEGEAGEAGELATATRGRIRRSLERRARSRHRMVRAGTITLVLLVSTVSWALSTGRIPLLTSKRAEPVEAPVELPPLASPAPVRRATKPRVPVEFAVPDTAWIAPPVETVPPTPSPATTRSVQAPVKRPVAPRPAEVLYRKAHDLHFRGSDRVAALAAWDAYLAAEPTGRFSVEARYNRALALVRLGRYSEGRAALAPYARGEIGYRQHEAAQLVERLDQIEQAASKALEPNGKNESTIGPQNGSK